MIIHSVLTNVEYEILKKDGKLFCDASKTYYPNSDKIFKIAYDFMSSHLEKKFPKKNINAPFELKYPRWAWHTINGNTDIKKMNKFHFINNAKETTYLVSINIPDEQVLLSDFELWHCCLNAFPIFDRKEDEEMEHFVYHILKTQYFKIIKNEDDNIVYSFLCKKIFQSWEKIFDLSFYDEYYVSKERTIQAVFWYIDIKQVFDVNMYSCTQNEYDEYFRY